MAYNSGTITHANPASQLYTEVVESLDAHGNWDFVETVTSGPTNYSVWQNRGSGTGLNSFGQDFFVIFEYNPTGGTNLTVKACEQWDATNDKLIRPCTGVTASRTPNANGSYGNETTGFTLTDSTDVAYARCGTVTTGFDYFIQVSANRICIATKYSTTDHALYVGIFESLLAADPFPLCIGGTSGQENINSGDFGVSRHPNKTTAAAQNFMFQLAQWSTVSGNAETADLMHGTSVASRVLLRHNDGTVGTYGLIRGLLYDCMYLPDGTTATRNGDSITVAADTWRKMKMGTVGLTVGVWVKEAAA